MEDERIVWEGQPSQLVNLGLCVVCSFLVWLVVPVFVALQRFLQLHFTRYRLTSERFEITTGVLSRRTEQLELYRVKDLTVEEPILLRMVGLGNVIVHSSDRSHPVLVLQGVKDCTMLRNQVRGLVVLPERNRRDVEEVSAELLEGLALEYVGPIDEALEQTLVAS